MLFETPSNSGHTDHEEDGSAVLEGQQKTTVTSAQRCSARRASLACTNCRVRKVRCIILNAEKTCVNCQRDEVDCILSRSRVKRYMIFLNLSIWALTIALI